MKNNSRDGYCRENLLVIGIQPEEHNNLCSKMFLIPLVDNDLALMFKSRRYQRISDDILLFTGCDDLLHGVRLEQVSSLKEDYPQAVFVLFGVNENGRLYTYSF